VIWRVVSFGLLNIPKKSVTTKDTNLSLMKVHWPDQIRCRFPATRVAILTGYDDSELRKVSLDAGAFAFIPKVGVGRDVPFLFARIASVRDK
jgi:DNA-binding NarL/FixJ family response regulator